MTLDSDEMMLFVAQPEIRVHPHVLSANMQVRFQVTQYASMLATRQPTATGVLSGTGLAAAGCLLTRRPERLG